MWAITKIPPEKRTTNEFPPLKLSSSKKHRA